MKWDKKNFIGSTTPAAMAKTFDDKNADERSVCGS